MIEKSVNIFEEESNDLIEIHNKLVNEIEDLGKLDNEKDTTITSLKIEINHINKQLSEKSSRILYLESSMNNQKDL